MEREKQTKQLTSEEKQTIKWAKSYYGSSAPIQKIYVPKAKKELLIVFKCDPRCDRECMIVLLDGPDSIANPISFIRYELRSYGMHISYFKTRYDYQGTGLGKFIYQLAQAHADKVGLKFSNGLICPVDDIKGVTTNSDDSIEKEFKFLALMYHALGNKIIEKNTYNGIDLTFEDNWKKGQKIEKLNDDQKEYLEKIYNFELNKAQKYFESTNNKGKNK